MGKLSWVDRPISSSTAYLSPSAMILIIKSFCYFTGISFMGSKTALNVSLWPLSHVDIHAKTNNSILTRVVSTYLGVRTFDWRQEECHSLPRSLTRSPDSCECFQSHSLHHASPWQKLISKSTSDAGSQYRCGRVGRGGLPPSTPNAPPPF